MNTNIEPPKMLEIDEQKRGLSLALEAIFGIFFLFGIGWLYAGNKVRGLVLLVGSLLSITAISSFILATGGFGYCLCGLPIYASLVFDVLSLRKWLARPVPEDFKGMMKSGLIFLVIGLLIICIAMAVILLKLPKYLN